MTALPIRYRRAARAEYDDAVDWYEARQPGLGVRVQDAVEDRFQLIAADPVRFAVAHGDLRAADVPGFPYVINYVPCPTPVGVLPVFRASRNPNVWKRRRYVP